MSLIIGISRILLPALTVIILTKCMLSLVLGHPKEKTYGYIIDMLDGESYPLNMWETSIGRSNSCDVVVGYDTVSRFQAVISRRIDGWYVYDLLSKSGVKINGEGIDKKSTIKSGDILSFGGMQFRFMVADDPVVRVGKKKRGKKNQAQPAPAFEGRESYRQRQNYEPGQSDTYRQPYGNFNPGERTAPYGNTPPSNNSASNYGSESVYEEKPKYTASSDETDSIYDESYTYSSMADGYYYSDENKPDLHFEKHVEKPFKENYSVPKAETVQSDEDSIYSDKPTFTVETPDRSSTVENFTYQEAKPTIFNRDTGEVFILCGNNVSIGRSRGNDIKLMSPSVSRHHADLVLYEDGWAIVDASSSAGTTLNGEKITEPQLLFEGDVIGLSDERLYFTRNPALYK